ncbi:MAG TPA: adenylate kinase [Rhodanobacteraceae bacterium]|nr:adenylate kinase [Rhodanobacteraceae bacterium]
MRLVLLGAPGSGKGTQADCLKDALGAVHISTGDLLRAAVAAGTPLGLQAKAVMESGRLVSDEIVLGMLEERLGQGDAHGGFILDGYPRNLAQAAALDSLLGRLGQPLDQVVKLSVPNEVIVGRCETRFAAEGRADDEPQTVRKRLAVFDEQTAPVADWYRKRGQLSEVDGVGTVEDVCARIMAALDAGGRAAVG